jgi:type II secretion system protein N
MSNSHGRVPILYLVYGLVLFCVLVAVFFPYSRLAATVLRRIERQTGVQVSYGDLAYVFPAGCRLERAQIAVPTKVGKIHAYKGEELTLKVSPLSLFRKNVNVRFEGDGYGGGIAGKAAFALPVGSGAGAYRLTVDGVDVREILAPFYLRNFKLTGALTGEADLELNDMDNLATATGNLDAALRDGEVRNIFVRGLDLPDFAFKVIRSKGTLENENLQVQECHIDSEILLAEIEGEIRLNTRDLRDSQLNLKANLRPQRGDPANLHSVAALFGKTLDAEGYYPFRLFGTFRQPEVQ